MPIPYVTLKEGQVQENPSILYTPEQRAQAAVNQYHDTLMQLREGPSTWTQRGSPGAANSMQWPAFSSYWQNNPLVSAMAGASDPYQGALQYYTQNGQKVSIPPPAAPTAPTGFMGGPVSTPSAATSNAAQGLIGSAATTTPAFPAQNATGMQLPSDYWSSQAQTQSQPMKMQAKTDAPVGFAMVPGPNYPQPGTWPNINPQTGPTEPSTPTEPPSGGPSLDLGLTGSNTPNSGRMDTDPTGQNAASGNNRLANIARTAGTGLSAINAAKSLIGSRGGDETPATTGGAGAAQTAGTNTGTGTLDWSSGLGPYQANALQTLQNRVTNPWENAYITNTYNAQNWLTDLLANLNEGGPIKGSDLKGMSSADLMNTPAINVINDLISGKYKPQNQQSLEDWVGRLLQGETPGGMSGDIAGGIKNLIGGNTPTLDQNVYNAAQEMLNTGLPANYEKAFYEEQYKPALDQLLGDLNRRGMVKSGEGNKEIRQQFQTTLANNLLMQQRDVQNQAMNQMLAAKQGGAGNLATGVGLGSNWASNLFNNAMQGYQGTTNTGLDLLSKGLQSSALQGQWSNQNANNALASLLGQAGVYQNIRDFGEQSRQYDTSALNQLLGTLGNYSLGQGQLGLGGRELDLKQQQLDIMKNKDLMDALIKGGLSVAQIIALFAGGGA